MIKNIFESTALPCLTSASLYFWATQKTSIFQFSSVPNKVLWVTELYKLKVQIVHVPSMYWYESPFVILEYYAVLFCTLGYIQFIVVLIKHKINLDSFFNVGTPSGGVHLFDHLLCFFSFIYYTLQFKFLQVLSYSW